MHPSSFLLPQGRAVGVGLQARREQVGGEVRGVWGERAGLNDHPRVQVS